jgi:N-acetylglutamate synthase-like GNAT family acetyltransferase
MTIRQADQHDFRGCLEVLPKVYRASNFEARLGHQLLRDYVFVALDDDGKVMGFLTCDADFFDADGFYLRSTVVKQEHGDKNVAEALVRAATKYAFAHNCRRVFADVVEPALAKRLEKGGFEKVGEIKHMHCEDITYQVYSLKAGAKI